MAARAGAGRGGGAPASQQVKDLQKVLNGTSNADAIDDCLELLKSELTKRRVTKPNDKVAFPTLLNGYLLRNVRTRKHPPSVLVVGHAGVGKSSLINTLAQEYVCNVDVRTNDTRTTKGLESNLVKIDIGGESCELIIWDSQGLSGDTEEDECLFKEIEAKVQNPDLVIICHDITALSGRINGATHHEMLRRLHSVNGGQLFDQCVIALTKFNIFALSRQSDARLQKEHEHPGVDLIDDDWHDDFQKEVEHRMEIWPNALRESGVFQGQIDRIPVCIFGRMNFSRSASHMPINVTAIGPFGERWLQDSWGKMLPVAKGGLSSLLVIMNNEFDSNPEIHLDMRDATPDLPQYTTVVHDAFKEKKKAADGDFLTKALYAGVISVAAILAPVTGGVSIGAGSLVMGGIAIAKAAGDVQDRYKKGEQRQRTDEARERIQFREAFYREYTLGEAEYFIDELQRAHAKRHKGQQPEQ